MFSQQNCFSPIEEFLDSLLYIFCIQTHTHTHTHTPRSGLSKLFSKSKSKEEGDEDGPTSDHETATEPHKSHQPTKEEEEERDRVSMTPEPLKKAPPPVRKKPVKSKSVDFGVEMGREEDGEEKRRRPVGGVAAMPLPGIAPSQLTGVLKPRPTPQPRSKVSSERIHFISTHHTYVH